MKLPVFLFTAIPAFILAVVFSAIFYFSCKRKKKQKNNDPVISSSAGDAVSSWSFHPNIQISMDEISKATNNFSPDHIIGDGSFGLVYKACLSTGIIVAVKILSSEVAFHNSFREFQAELETLGKLRHRNIVKILGSWASGSERLLVYEFLERGNLDQWLHGDDADTVLHWETRVKIIKGVANGLRYLHGLEKPIIHRDINSRNVLLDSEFEAHIAEFGLARMIEPRESEVSSQFTGSLGYMPPEYRDGVSVANAMLDVYSFGVLMLETFTGLHPNSPVLFTGGKEMGLVECARKMVAQNAEMEIVDPKITRDARISEGSVKEYFKIACMCCSELQKDRPMMTVIVDLLDRVET